MEVALDVFVMKTQESPPQQKHLAWRERQQRDRKKWCDVVAALGMTMEVALSVFDRRAQRVHLT